MSVEPLIQPAERRAPGAIPCHDPATGEPLGEIAVDDAAAVARAVVAARHAQQSWGKTPFKERRRVLRLLLDRVLEQADDLAEAIVRDAGKTRENAMLGEIWPVCEKLRWTLANGARHLKTERVSPGMLLHKRARIAYRPRGVIGVITPWNYPFQNILAPIIPALMAGNACVVKVSEQVAWSSARVQRLLNEVFDEARVPRALVHIVQGYADTGRALIAAGIDQVVFTGSLDNGKSVARDAGANLVPAILELGGKDPLIVADDAHLDEAVHAALAGVYINCGQNCLAAERVLVQGGIYDRFEARIVDAVSQLRQGPSRADVTVDVAAIVSPLQLDRIAALVDEAVADGARVLVGGHRVGDGPGQLYAPTVLADVRPEMRIMQEEVFGPVMLLCRYRDDDEAVTIANGTAFALGCTIMTRDAERAERLAARVRAGNISINAFALTYMANDLPFGGVGGSGYGRLNGRDGLRAFTTPTAIMSDRLPFPAPTKLYPVHPADYDVARGVIRTLYGRGIRGRLGGLVELARAARQKLGR